MTHLPSILSLPRSVALACALAALPASHLAQAQTAAPADTPASAAAPADAKTAIETHLENAERLQGLKSVALASFQVYMLNEFEAGSTAQGGSTRGSISSTHSNMKVVGLEPARLQALTDELYQSTLAMLKSRGIAVMEPAALDALPAMTALKAAADKAPLPFDAAGGKGQIYSAAGLPLLHVYENAWLHRSGGMFGPKIDDHYVSLGDKMSVGFRLTTLQPLLKDLAVATQMPLLHVRLVLAPGGVQASKGGFFAGSSETKTTSTLVMPVYTNRFMVTTADGGVGRVSLNTALLSDQGMGELVDVTSSAETAGNVALAAFSILAAASGTGRAVINNSRKQELRTSHELFDGVAKAQSTQVLQAMSAKLAP